MPETYDVGAAVARVLDSGDIEKETVEMTIVMSGDAAHLLSDLATKLELDRGRVIADALSLLYIGVTAQRDGMLMAVVDREGKAQTSLDLLPGD